MDRLAGSTDQSVSFAAWTTATGAAVTVTSATAGLSLWYRRGSTGAKTAISPSDLATLETAHADGGILVVQDQEHRLDLPDAAFAAGVDYLEWGGSATGITIDGGSCNLIGQATTGSVGAPLTSVQTQAAAAAAIAAADLFAAIVQNQLTESYASDGVAPTLEQAIFLIQQSLHEFSISGTTRTVKKLDGSTTAATFTLDSETAPTSTTRAS